MPHERLGCLDDLQIFVTDKCNAPRICQLTNIISVAWNRKLDDISEAAIVVGLSDPECCECMADIEPWCHMIHIIRNGVIVWQGPVVRITYGFNQVTIEARDILAFLQVSVPQGSLTVGPKEITDIAIDVLNVGFADRDDCFMGNVIQTDITQGSRPTLFANTYISPDNGFSAFDGSVFDWLQILAENGLDYTALGLTLILSVEDAALQPIGVLTDEHILGEIEVSKDGYLMSNRVWVRYQGDDSADDATDANGNTIPGCRSNCTAGNNGVTCLTCNETGNVQPCFNVPCPAFREATEQFCYGPIDRLFNNGEVGNLVTAEQTADAYVRAGSLAARTIEFPSGTKLSPDTPWGINDMIPGQRVDVAFTELCLNTFQSFRLLEVSYELDADSDEVISVSMGPMNAVGSI